MPLTQKKAKPAPGNQGGEGERAEVQKGASENVPAPVAASSTASSSGTKRAEQFVEPSQGKIAKKQRCFPFIVMGPGLVDVGVVYSKGSTSGASLIDNMFTCDAITTDIRHLFAGFPQEWLLSKRKNISCLPGRGRLGERRQTQTAWSRL